MTNISQATNEFFNQRKRFIVIGLTGRTGSGCSTTANLLEMSWDDLKPPKPKLGQLTLNEDRKYRVLYNFAKKNWKPFCVIQIKDIITYFIVKEPIEKFEKFLNTIVKEPYELELIKEKVIKPIKEEYAECQRAVETLPKIYEDFEENTNEKEDDFLKFYFEKLPSFSEKLKEALRQISQVKYTEVYQNIGNNIRNSGCAFGGVFSPSNMFAIAKSTNKIIKILRHQAKRKNNEVLVVIDAIRNPFEATYFRDRYSAFYLISVNCPKEDRVGRLQRSNDYCLSQVKSIDEEYEKEKYEKKEVNEFFYVSQNLKMCIEFSDIYFTNHNIGINDFSELKKQIIWYVSLIIHPGLVTPTSYERAMQVAYNAKLNSGCISRQVGAVVTDESFSIKSVGWNNTPEGQVPCILRNVNDILRGDDKCAYSDFENNDLVFKEKLVKEFGTFLKKVDQSVLMGRNISYCFKEVNKKNEKNPVESRSLHAEENAFLQISKYGGQALKGGLLFTTASPCELCSKKAYQIGIKEIIYIDPYPGIANQHILNCGTKRPKLTLFSGTVGRAFHQLYQPIFSYKDELKMLSVLS